MIVLTKPWKRYLPGRVLSELTPGIEDLLVNRLRVASYEIPSGVSDGAERGADHARPSEEATRNRGKRHRP